MPVMPAQFAALLRARLAPGALHGAPLRFVVRLAPRPAGVHAELSMQRGATLIERQLAAASCAEALDALALVAALILDPTPPAPAASASRSQRRDASHAERRDASRTHAAPVSPAEPSTQASPPTVAPEHVAEPASVASESAAPAPAATAAAAPVTAQAASPADSASRQDTGAAPAAARAKRQRVISLFAGALLLQGVAPVLRPGASLGLALGVRRKRLELGFEIEARIAVPHSVESPEGNARFDFGAGAGKFCALGLFAQARLGVSGCAVAELGALGARGSDTDDAGGGHDFWAALGPALRVELRTRHVWIRLGSELLLPLPRQRYTLAEETVFSVPYVTFRTQLALGVPFS